MKNYSEIIQQLVDVNDKLINGKIDINVAKQVCINTQTLINAAKLQLEVLKFQQKTESEFFLEPIGDTLREIESNQKKPYPLS